MASQLNFNQLFTTETPLSLYLRPSFIFSNSLSAEQSEVNASAYRLGSPKVVHVFLLSPLYCIHKKRGQRLRLRVMIERVTGVCAELVFVFCNRCRLILKDPDGGLVTMQAHSEWTMELNEINELN